MKHFKARRLMKKASCAKGSFRTLKRGSKRIVICCPKGAWAKRAKRCRVGTRAYEILTRR